MSPDANKAIVRRFIVEVLTEGNREMIPQLVDHGYVNRYTGQGFEELLQYAGLMKAEVPDAHYRIESMIAEGDEVVVRYVFSGTVTGSIFESTQPGKWVTVRGITYYRLQNGRIVEEDPVNAHDLMQAIGVNLPLQV
jgi:predicted ester cyclase